ncbi:MAG: hypothetical protein WD768_02985 [Phycisphaeraceae bacterium]
MWASRVFDSSPAPEIAFYSVCFLMSWCLAPRIRWPALTVIAAFIAAASVQYILWADSHSTSDDWTRFEDVLLRGRLWERGDWDQWRLLIVYWILPFPLCIATTYFSRRRFRVVKPTVKDTLCPRCGYDLRGSADQPACPECGTDIAWEKRKFLRRRTTDKGSN